MNKEKAILILLFVSSLILGLLTIYTFKLEDRIEKLEEDYKIYEINLNNLENNKEVQFEVK